MHQFEQRKKNSWLKVLMRILPLSPTAWGLLVMTIVLEQSVVADNDNLFLGAVVSFFWFVGATTWLFTIVIYWLIKRKLDKIAFSLSTKSCSEMNRVSSIQTPIFSNPTF